MKLSDLVFDRRCSICNRQINCGAVCDECDADILSCVKLNYKNVAFGGKTARAAYIFEYETPVVKKLLFALKQRANKDLFKYAAGLYKIAVNNAFDITVTNCPRRGRGIRNYGYDQVSEPCKIMCKSSDGSLKYEALLKRRLCSREQKKLGLEQRIKNTKGKFRIIKKDIPKNILVVDDVITSGSTAAACAEELLKARPDAHIAFAFLASRNGFSGKG